MASRRGPRAEEKVQHTKSKTICWLSVRALLFVFVVISVSLAQKHEPTNSIAAADMRVVTKYIPNGFAIYESQAGNLNLDKEQDLLVVLETQTMMNYDSWKQTGETKEENRPLLIFTRKNGVLHFVARNDHVVLCRICGGVWGDPFESLVIKDGFFSVGHYGGSNWRWTLIVTFRYYPKSQDWFLWKQGGDSFHTSAPEQTETKVKTQKDFGWVSFERYNPGNIK